LIKTLKNRN